MIWHNLCLNGAKVVVLSDITIRFINHRGFPLVFSRLIRTFDLVEGSFSRYRLVKAAKPSAFARETKEKRLFFCFLLAYSYLCSRKQD